MTEPEEPEFVITYTRGSYADLDCVIELDYAKQDYCNTALLILAELPKQQRYWKSCFLNEFYLLFLCQYNYLIQVLEDDKFIHFVHHIYDYVNDAALGLRVKQ